MTDDEVLELISAYKSGNDLIIYDDHDVTVLCFTASTGRIFIFTGDLDLDDKFRKYKSHL